MWRACILRFICLVSQGEQLRRLRAENIAVTITPGVPSFAAAAAALGTELTLPGLAQSVVLTRTTGRASAMPEREPYKILPAQAQLWPFIYPFTIWIVVATLSPLYGADCPAAVVYRVSWPDQQIIRAPLDRLLVQLPEEVERTALILVGPALAEANFDDSCLYASDYDRRFRPQKALQGKLT